MLLCFPYRSYLNILSFTLLLGCHINHKVNPSIRVAIANSSCQVVSIKVMLVTKTDYNYLLRSVVIQYSKHARPRLVRPYEMTIPQTKVSILSSPQ